MTLLLLVGMSGATYLGLLVSRQEPSTGRVRHLPDYALIILAASGLTAVLAARLVTRPLSRLAEAAESFAASLDPKTLSETGPSELKAAIATFNLMQQRVSEGVTDRLHMLSAVNHDLRTPLTRISLRLEQVSNPELRCRLRGDITIIETMVARATEFVRSGTDSETPELVDLDALLQTVADNASELGGAVHFDSPCGLIMHTAPETLSRCLTNLVDNAVRHAGGATLGCRAINGGAIVTVADSGPGIPAHLLEEVFKPFTRLGDKETYAEGSGLGLAIARRQARSVGGEVTLANRDQGLIASVRLPG